jgi:hypothetical protein
MSNVSYVANELLTASDASRFVLGELSPAAFRAAAARGKLRVAVVTRGGVHLFEQHDIEQYLAHRAARRRAAA